MSQTQAQIDFEAAHDRIAKLERERNEWAEKATEVAFRLAECERKATVTQSAQEAE